ncbi:MAG: GMC family oxidoreductase [Deltaproteobacteria bacterium]|nr:GMC family oxidoreductase [Deltaproteobacteria bacterium]
MRWRALAEVATPAGEVLPPPGDLVAARAEALVGELGPWAPGVFGALLEGLDLAAMPFTGKRFSALDLEARRRVLGALQDTGPAYWALRALTAPLKMAAAQDEALRLRLGLGSGPRVLATERQRWEERVFDARALDGDETLEADVVIVGTGAGGAPLARTLASRGHAVLLLEEGGRFTRKDFGATPAQRYRAMYRQQGATVAFGNTILPIPVGMTFGGSTTVNSGTCYRTPDDVLLHWAEALGLEELRPEAMAPWFERVEEALGVGAPAPSALGGCARAIARGAEALGWRHGPLQRNAPGCDGQGLCAFGCPTDAKRGTNVSYLPEALKAGAVVYTHCRVDRVLVEGGRAVGVVARCRREDGRKVTLTVRARAVTLACGALHTPALLLRQGLANGSGELGKNLTIHPASQSWAAFDAPVRGWEAIPQGYAIEEFEREGIRFEGVFVPLEIAAGTLGSLGGAWTRRVERFDRLACFGFMVRDRALGRVRAGPGREPLVTYWLGDAERRKVVRGHALLARVWLAAGARAVYPGVQRFEELRSEGDVQDLETRGARELRAHHLDLTAFHPLGTCRMGTDPHRSVIGPSHETHDVGGLFVVDGSAVPTALGVNPQITIMALSERSAGFVERAIEAPRGHSRYAVPDGSLTFRETMRGPLTLTDGRSVEALFHVSAAAGPGDLSLARREVRFRLQGTVRIPGVVTDGDTEGTLVLSPLKPRGTLVYDLAFNDDQGQAVTLHGEKHLTLAPTLGLVTLYTTVTRAGSSLGEGILTFHLETLPAWLRSWAV